MRGCVDLRRRRADDGLQPDSLPRAAKERSARPGGLPGQAGGSRRAGQARHRNKPRQATGGGCVSCGGSVELWGAAWSQGGNGSIRCWRMAAACGCSSSCIWIPVGHPRHWRHHREPSHATDGCRCWIQAGHLGHRPWLVTGVVSGSRGSSHGVPRFRVCACSITRYSQLINFGSNQLRICVLLEFARLIYTFSGRR